MQEEYFDEAEEGYLEESGEYDEELEVCDEVVEERDLEVPDVSWKEDILAIESETLREIEIEKAEALKEERDELSARLDAREIEWFDFWVGNELLRVKESKAATRCALESVDLTWDHLAEVSQDYHLLTRGDLETMETKEDVDKRIGELGPDAAQELADKMLEEGKIHKEAHETISRRVRMHRADHE
jgi:hypothetical protein